ncbi:hypothetical protein AGR1C_Cc30099 [Agrobacterium fabacearum TT111]|nr:hypothetical protein AGR1C_Cc30099 [Agrobacterium fabacearum TT111]
MVADEAVTRRASLVAALALMEMDACDATRLARNAVPNALICAAAMTLLRAVNKEALDAETVAAQRAATRRASESVVATLAGATPATSTT